MASPAKKKKTNARNRVRRLSGVRENASACAYCGGLFDAGNPATVDHVVPLAHGGRNNFANLVAACDPCNKRKKDRLVSELHIPHVNQLRGALKGFRNCYARDPNPGELADWAVMHGKPIVGWLLAEEFLRREHVATTPAAGQEAAS